MSGPPQGHLCGKTLLHTRGFGLKILHPKTPNNNHQTNSAQQHFKHQQTSKFQSQLTPTLTKRQQSQAN